MARRSWQRENPESFRELQERLRVDFPELHFVERSNTLVVAGTYPLVDGQRVVDRFSIELELPRTYPKGLPVLREVGGRIPRSPKRHVESDGKACVFLPDEFSYKHPDGMDLIDFLKGPVLGYLVGQSLVDRGLPWPQGERGHSDDGIAQFYGELVGSPDRAVIRRYLEVLAAKQARGHWPCPCGSGARLRDCHREFILRLRERIHRPIARRSLELMKNGAARL